jgi:hypothetical protein
MRAQVFFCKFLEGVQEEANHLIEQSMEIRASSYAGRAEGRLTGKSPGQAPFLVPLEEAELLRRVRHEKVLRLLAVRASQCC